MSLFNLNRMEWINTVELISLLLSRAGEISPGVNIYYFIINYYCTHVYPHTGNTFCYFRGSL